MVAANATVSLPLIGRLSQRVIPDPVANPSDGLERGTAEWPVNLLPQRANIDVDDARVTFECEVPHVLDQAASRQHVVRVAHEVLKQRELGRSQPDSHAAASNLMAGRVQR